MLVSQQAVADALGLSRSTITKILNRDPKYSASEQTRDLVFRTAERMGYDFTTIRRPFKREYGRTKVNTPCTIKVLLADNELFDSGDATALNIGVGGVLLTNLNLSKGVLPLRQFRLRLRFTALPMLAALVGECQVVRIADSATGEPELGVKFIKTTVADRKLLKDFVDRQAAKESPAKASSVGGE